MNTESQGAAPKGAGGGHTPGPWRVEGTRVVSDAGVIVRQDAAYDAAQDDLRLIAAAPLMAAQLAAVDRVLTEFEGMTSAGYRYMAANIRAALAKAGGES